MSPTRRELLIASSAAVVLRAVPLRAAENAAGAAAVLGEIAEALLRDFPENATNLGIDKGARAALKSQLTDHSAAGQRVVARHVAEHLARLRTLDAAAMSDAEQLDVEVARTAFELAGEGFAFPYGDVAVGGYRNTPYAVAQNVGAFIDVPRFLDSEHTITTPADAEAYLARLESYPDQLDGETEHLKHDAANGVIAPDFLLDKTLKAIRIARAGEVEQWSVVRSLATRTRTVKGDFAARAAQLATERLAPALDRQIAELERHRRQATPEAGAWKLPQGEAYYAWALRAGTTTRRGADEVHELGLEELRALQAEMDPILRTLGYERGSVGERMAALNEDRRFMFPDDDSGREQVMALLRNRLEAMRAKMPQVFNTLVRGNVEVKRLPPEVEPGAAGAYGGPGTIDGSVPGRFWINLRTTALWRQFSLPTLAYHEAIPGHVWQGEYTFRLPLIRMLLQFNAYSEGWALYSEQLADELGAYENDPVGRLGYLHSIAFRACRLVVDTGLHAKRWTRAQAIDWFVRTNGSNHEEVEGEVDRYCAWPGQACGYKVGHSEIKRLRARAQATLGERFDLRRFDDALVLGGNVPLTVLEKVIDRHIGAVRAETRS